MVGFTKIYSLRFKHIIAFFLLATSLTLISWSMGAIIFTKNDTIVDDNYKGKYLKVKHYKAYNKDSVYEYYYKPKEFTVKVVGKSKKHILFFKEEELAAKGDKNKIRKIKNGQTIKVIEYFYPYHEYKIK
jgi:hypothetical protein